MCRRVTEKFLRVNISLPIGIINEINLNYVKACKMCQTVKLSPQILRTWFWVSCRFVCLEGFSFLKPLRVPSLNILPISARSSHVARGSKAACNVGSKLLTSYIWKSKFSLWINMVYVKSGAQDSKCYSKFYYKIHVTVLLSFSFGRMR